MEKVKDILAVKGGEVVTVAPETSLYRALEKMVEFNIGALVVVDAGGAIQGIFSERDFVRKIIIKGRDCDNSTVREAMTSRVIYVEPETSIQDCMNLMTEKRIRHLPVLSASKLVGLVSIGDVVKAILAMKESVIFQQAFEIGQLERYISGGP